LCYSQSGDDPEEDLAKFDNKLNMKMKYLKQFSIFLATQFQQMYKKIWKKILNFAQKPAIENFF